MDAIRVVEMLENAANERLGRLACFRIPKGCSSTSGRCSDTIALPSSIAVSGETDYSNPSTA